MSIMVIFSILKEHDQVRVIDVMSSNKIIIISEVLAIWLLLLLLLLLYKK